MKIATVINKANEVRDSRAGKWTSTCLVLVALIGMLSDHWKAVDSREAAKDQRQFLENQFNSRHGSNTNYVQRAIAIQRAENAVKQKE